MPWVSKNAQASAIGQLFDIQRLACLSATGAMSTTPTVVVKVQFNLTPVQILLQIETRTVIHKLVQGQNPIS